jgi:hypothetical protein
MLAFDRRALGAAHAAPGRPQTGEREQWPVRIKREPFWRLARFGVRVFAKRCRRDDAATRLRQPPAPVRAADIADVRDRRAAELRRAGHSPARHDKLTLALGADPKYRRHLVGEDRGEQWQVARPIMRCPKSIADSGLTLGQRVEVAHGADAYGAAIAAYTRVVLAPFSPVAIVAYA